MLTMKDVIEHNKDTRMHFFDKETMDFWGCKIESELIDDKYFITSELNFDGSKRLYTVRKYNWNDGMITDFGFQNCKTLKEAQDYLNELKE